MGVLLRGLRLAIIPGFVLLAVESNRSACFPKRGEEGRYMRFSSIRMALGSGGLRNIQFWGLSNL